MKTVVSKGEFAKIKNRTPSAVSNWIAAGQIKAASLVGKGQRAKIWLEQAERDLAGSLDPSQQVSQAPPVLPSVRVEDPAPARRAPPPDPDMPLFRAAVADRELDLARRAKADADKAEHDAEAARRKLAVDEGRYILAEDAAREWGRELSRFMSNVETFMSSTLARDLAASHGLDWKALSVEIRERFRAFRADTSEEARSRREALKPEEAGQD